MAPSHRSPIWNSGWSWRYQGKTIGDLKAVYTEHPIQDRTDEEMLGIADEAFDALMAGLLEES